MGCHSNSYRLFDAIVNIYISRFATAESSIVLLSNVQFVRFVRFEVHDQMQHASTAMREC